LDSSPRLISLVLLSALCRRADEPLRVISSTLLHGCCTEVPNIIRILRFARCFCLQNAALRRWAMLGSNQRPLPCESGSCSFATVRRYPVSAFLSLIARYRRRERPPSFAPVVVKLSSRNLPLNFIHPRAFKVGVLGSSHSPSPISMSTPHPNRSVIHSEFIALILMIAVGQRFEEHIG
jgi:hypothetical protein